MAHVFANRKQYILNHIISFHKSIHAYISIHNLTYVRIIYIC